MKLETNWLESERYKRNWPSFITSKPLLLVNLQALLSFFENPIYGAVVNYKQKSQF